MAEETEVKVEEIKEEVKVEEEKPLENPFEPPEEKTEEEKAAEEATAKAAKDAEDAKKAEEEAAKKITPAEPDEVVSLRQITRTQRNEIAELKAKSEQYQKALEKAELIPKEDEEAAAKAAEVASGRMGQLNTLLEAMKLNESYKDVEEVVSQPHFDDLVDMMSEYIVQQSGGNVTDINRALTSEIWGLPNPYRYMYDLIKEFHPDFAKPVKEGEKKDEKGEGKDKKETSAPVVPKVPGTIQDIPGGGGAVKGWTSAMIDALEEDELGKVPKDVYDLYLQNQLP